MNHNLSIVIPVFNEEQRIGDTLSKLTGYIKRNNLDAQIIVVDDGSTDKTETILEKFLPQITVISYAPNHGKGYAIKQGILKADGEYILFMDADLATPLKEIPILLEQLREVDADIAIGSRKLENNKVQRTPMRAFASRVFSYISHLIIPLNFCDTQCGFKIFKNEVAKEIFYRAKIERWAFDLEILYLAESLNFKVIECEVEWRDMAGSKVQMSKDAFLMIRDILAIRWHSYIGNYNLNSFLVEGRSYDVIPEQSGEAKEL